MPTTTAKERKTRNRLFSSSESESSDSASDDRTTRTIDTTDTTTRSGASQTTATPAAQPHARALSLASGRSVSAKQSSSASFDRLNGSSLNTSDPRRKSLTTSSSFKGAAPSHTTRESSKSSFLGASNTSNSLFPERRGLFEQEDDESDASSIESLHAQSRLRHQQKQSELERVKSDLAQAQQRIAALESNAATNDRDRDALEIRLRECYRIIEKRNRQLMKASERVARYSEQAESQLLALQTRVAELTALNDTLTANAAAAQDASVKEMKAALRDQQRLFETQHAAASATAAAALLAAHTERDALATRLQQVEVDAAQRQQNDATAQELLRKRCDDAEAISRGLAFQLEKAQHEKQFLKNQWANLQSNDNGAVGFEAYGVDNRRDSGASSVASAADLASFDYSRASMLESPVREATAATAATTSLPTRRHTAFIPPPPIDTSSYNDKANDTSNSNSVSDSLPLPVDAIDSKQQQAPPPPPPPAATTPTLVRPGSASTNFFEKLSIKFKRSASSPRATTHKSESQSNGAASTAPPAAAAANPTSGASFSSAAASFTSVFASAAATPSQAAESQAARTQAQRAAASRPKMYVAKAPSTYDDESSDSIFGSESDSSDHLLSGSDGSDDDVEGDSSPPLPPPPPRSDDEASALPPQYQQRTAATVNATRHPRRASANAAASLFGRPRHIDGSARLDRVGAVLSSSSSSSSDSNDDDDAVLIGLATAASSNSSSSNRPMPSTTTATTQELPRIPVQLKTPDGRVADASLLSSSSSDNDSVDVTANRTTRHVSLSPPPHAQAAANDAGDDSDASSSSLSSSSSSSSSDRDVVNDRKRRHRRRERDGSNGYDRNRTADNDNGDDDNDNVDAAATTAREKPSRRSSSLPRTRREKRHSTSNDASNDTNDAGSDATATAAGATGTSHTSKSRMNEYMEARAKKRRAKLERKEAKEHAAHQQKAAYEQEWEQMAQEERERKRKQQQQQQAKGGRSARRRPSSLKTVRVSQMKQQQLHKQATATRTNDDTAGGATGADDERAMRRPSQRRKSDARLSDSDNDNDNSYSTTTAAAAAKPPMEASTPLPPPPEPTEADTELYLRQQARLRERHELELQKKLNADEADLVRGEIHRRVELWAFGKELLHLILTLDQLTANDALQKCQLAVIQSPDNDTVRKAYRNIIRVIHPDKLRNATVPEQLEAKELFTILNQAFEKFKSQTS